MTTAQIMKEMLLVVKAEWKEEKYNIKLLSKMIKWLTTNSSKDIPLLFPLSCNYETWVFKRPNSKETIIQTCNNHDWLSSDAELTPISDYASDGDWCILKKFKFLDLSDMKTKTYKEYNDKLFEDEN